MPRVYYHKKELSGKPIEDDFLNSELLDYIFENITEGRFTFQDLVKSSFWGLRKEKIELFKTVYIKKDDIFYKAEEGSFYLPSAIIFTDNSDYPFPTEFYFISQIDQSIELRKCHAGKDVKWFQIPNLHQVEDRVEIIEKIKNTLKELKKLVEEKYGQGNKSLLLDQKQKRGYCNLIELCVLDKEKKQQLLEFVETLKNYDGDEDYFTTLNFVMDYLDENKFNFIIRMDWRDEIENLDWSMQAILKENYADLAISLPAGYDEEKTIAHEGVFEEFDKPLRHKGLQLGFIDTQADEYIAIIHKIADKEEVEKAINDIGYKYFEN